MTTKNFGKAVEAVSPVVATLLLVLVAAGAAIGFGVFMGGFQDEAQKNVGTDVGGDALTIGGSSTVFPLSQAGIQLYTAQHPGLNIQLTQGGSTLGVKGVGTCNLDIGSSSKAVSNDFLSIYPDCDGVAGKDVGRNLVQYGLGYDLVVPIVSTSACLENFALLSTEIAYIYGANGKSAPADYTGTRPVRDTGAGALTSIDGATGADQAAIDLVPRSTVTWDELEAYLDVVGGAGTAFSPTAGGVRAHHASDDCTTATFMGKAIKIYDREDKGGTSEVFCESLLFDAPGNKDGKALTLCDSEKQITKTTLANVNERDGNQLVENAVKGDALALGFSSVGTSQKNGLEIAGFDQTDVNYAQGMADNDKVDCPTDTSSSELDYHGLARAACHDGYRALFYVTVGEATGAAKAFIDFMQTPDVNLKLNEQIGYVSLY